jgi:hypothetical protein
MTLCGHKTGRINQIAVFMTIFESVSQPPPSAISFSQNKIKRAT